MATVTSPKLKLSPGCHPLSEHFLINKTSLVTWLCIEELQKFIHSPKAKSYWLEVNTRQWKDKSGCRVQVRFHQDSWGDSVPQYRRDRKDSWERLLDPFRKFLRKLGVVSDEDSKVVYFRLLYEE